MEATSNRGLWIAAVLTAISAGLVALDLGGYLQGRALLYRAAGPVFELAALTSDLKEGRAERAALAARLSERSLALGRAEGYRRENEALRAALGLRVEAPYEMIYAPIWDRRPERWLKAVTLGMGRNAGIEAGMPVMGTAGLVGRVMRVTADNAEVELITSERTRIAAAHAPSGEMAGYYADAAGKGHLAYLPRATDLRLGDLIVTAAAGGVYPPGLIIGTVESYRRPFDSMFCEVEIRPAEDFNRLEKAFVLKWRPHIKTAPLEPVIPQPGPATAAVKEEPLPNIPERPAPTAAAPAHTTPRPATAAPTAGAR